MKKGIVKFTKALFVISFIGLLVSSIVIFSYESSLNVKSQDVESEISKLEGDKESLELQVQEATSFSKVEEVAEKNGYTYRQSNSTATAVTTEE